MAIFPSAGSPAPLCEQVTAMDLGTSNTCVARWTEPSLGASASGLIVLRPEGWQNPALGGAIPSLVLYKEDKAFLIGAAAELEFGEASPQEKKQYTLRARFKPDIAAHDDARQWMIDFLQLLRSRVHVSGKLLVGIPCQAENHYQQVLRQCLAHTGWNDVRFLREPMGALVHYIAAGVLPPSLAARGVLTVDFGGGTCDLAVLRRAEVLSWHGDMLYGGRLFDDLFYQLLLEHNPDLEQRLEQEGNAYYVHWVASRRAKEDFSTSMTRDRSQAVTVRTRWSRFDGQQAREQSAYIEHLSWQSFLLRAGSYQASEALRQSLQEHSQRAGLSPLAQGLLAGKKVDLISWFEQLMHQSLHQPQSAHATQPGQQGDQRIPPTVLLTGGSSAWPFVEDLVRQTMGPQVRILRGDEPYADIAKGLAQYHVLAHRLSTGRAALQHELPLFMEQRIAEKAIHTTLDAGISHLLEECSNFLRTVVLLPEFARYRQEGGPLRALLENIAAAVLREDERLRAVLESAMQRMSSRITAACRTELQAWFREKGIPIVPERLEQRWLGGSLDTFLHEMSTELSKNTLAQNRQYAAFATFLTGPGLAALSISGTPLLALGVGVGGLVLMKLFHWDRWLAEASLALPLPKIVRSHVFSNARLSTLCDEQLKIFEENFRKQLFSAWEQSEQHILEEAALVAREEIKALDLLNITPS
ncbi:MAG: hypothetical protein RRY29_05130 [Desulfovibrionaceae bacterium]